MVDVRLVRYQGRGQWLLRLAVFEVAKVHGPVGVSEASELFLWCGFYSLKSPV